MATTLNQILLGRFDRGTIVERLNTSSALFRSAVAIAISDLKPQGWRAAWILGHATKPGDPRLSAERVNALIEAIDGKEDGQQRELLKLLMKAELSEEQEGGLFDVCMTIWEALDEKIPSVRVYAFRFMLRVVKKYPEMKDDMRVLSRGKYLRGLSSGVRRSVEKLRDEHL